MPFGPTNAPTFYTAMMKDFKDEWDKLFIIRILEMIPVDGTYCKLSTEGILFVDEKPLVWGSCIIIDDILLWCEIKRLLIVYFRCICEVFKNTGCHFV